MGEVQTCLLAEEKGIEREKLKIRVGFSQAQKSSRNLQAIQEDLIRIQLVANSLGGLRSTNANGLIKTTECHH